MRNITILILFLVSTNVFSEWFKIGKIDHAVVYADLPPNKIGKKATMVSLLDFDTVQAPYTGERYLSTLRKYEYNCENETTRIIGYRWYSENDGHGKVVANEDNLKIESESISPGSLDAALFKMACGQK